MKWALLLQKAQAVIVYLHRACEISKNGSQHTDDQTCIFILWCRVAERSPYAWSTYNVLMWAYLREAMVHPAQSEIYLAEFDHTGDVLFRNMTHWKSMRDNPTNAAPYRQSAQLFQMRNNLQNYPLPQQELDRVSIQAMADGAQPLNMTLVQKYIIEQVNQLSFTAHTAKSGQLYALWLALISRFQGTTDFVVCVNYGHFHASFYKNVFIKLQCK